MRAMMFSVLGAVAAALPAQAGTHFISQPIVIAGSSNVNATALNRQGVVTGSFSDTTEHGFIQDGATLTILPAKSGKCPLGCAVYPTAIDARGDVSGVTVYYQQPDSFLWLHEGRYKRTARRFLGNGSGVTIVGVNDRREQFYNQSTGSGTYIAFAGKAPSFTQFASGGLFVNSINDAGVLAGSVYEGQCGGCVFIGTPASIALLQVPGAILTEGGFINRAGQLAGTYVDSGTGSFKGFVYQNDVYATFNTKTRADTMAVQAINSTGRVVGVYDMAGSPQLAFLFNGQVTTNIQSFPAGDLVHAALNDTGTILISDTTSEGVSASYVVTCRGDGC